MRVMNLNPEVANTLREHVGKRVTLDVRLETLGFKVSGILGNSIASEDLFVVETREATFHFGALTVRMLGTEGEDTLLIYLR